MINFFVFRHGQSIYQCLRIIAGNNEFGLSALGQFQTHKIAQNMKDMKFDYIFSSDVKRSWETLAILRSYIKQPISSRNVYFVPLAREKHQGILSMKSITFFKQNDMDRNFRQEGGENWEDVQDRVAYFIDFLVKKLLTNNQNIQDYHPCQQDMFRVVQFNHDSEKIPSVLLITHYGFIKELIYLIKKKNNQQLISKDSYLGYYAQNACLFNIHLKKNGQNSWKPEIISMNSHALQYRPFE